MAWVKGSITLAAAHRIFPQFDITQIVIGNKSVYRASIANQLVFNDSLTSLCEGLERMLFHCIDPAKFTEFLESRPKPDTPDTVISLLTRDL